jgi:hypothetical protein
MPKFSMGSGKALGTGATWRGPIGVRFGELTDFNPLLLPSGHFHLPCHPCSLHPFVAALFVFGNGGRLIRFHNPLFGIDVDDGDVSDSPNHRMREKRTYKPTETLALIPCTLLAYVFLLHHPPCQITDFPPVTYSP